ncbi:hypothetical protein DIE28_16885 [Paracoccus thiocyanatus]|uniref:Transcription regulator HTH AraC N-terminal domain-containing protein n=1 Tax=Paracoccus thiocyanatus TaxID=34006 RepID=A0A3D8P748_9RHOB|nr:hypothetical protein DIE28_16885 [Paracoccus thiocyanatus]
MAAARTETEAAVVRYVEKHGIGQTAVPGLGVGLTKAPIPPSAYLFEPSLCIGARGSKRVRLGKASYVYDEDHFLLTAVGQTLRAPYRPLLPSNICLMAVMSFRSCLARSDARAGSRSTALKL